MKMKQTNKNDKLNKMGLEVKEKELHCINSCTHEWMNEWMNNDDDVKTMYNNDSPAHRLNFSYTIYWKMYMHTYIFFYYIQIKTHC